jgi:hypothetical protein
MVLSFSDVGGAGGCLIAQSDFQRNDAPEELGLVNQAKVVFK